MREKEEDIGQDREEKMNCKMYSGMAHGLNY